MQRSPFVSPGGMDTAGFPLQSARGWSPFSGQTPCQEATCLVLAGTSLSICFEMFGAFLGLLFLLQRSQKMEKGSAAVIPFWLGLLPTPTSMASVGSPCGQRALQLPRSAECTASLGPCREHGEGSRNSRPGQQRHAYMGKGSLESRDDSGEEQGSICVPAGRNP